MTTTFNTEHCFIENNNKNYLLCISDYNAFKVQTNEEFSLYSDKELKPDCLLSSYDSGFRLHIANSFPLEKNTKYLVSIINKDTEKLSYRLENMELSIDSNQVLQGNNIISSIK